MKTEITEPEADGTNNSIFSRIKPALDLVQIFLNYHNFLPGGHVLSP